MCRIARDAYGACMTASSDDLSFADRARRDRPPTDVLCKLLADLLDEWIDQPDESRTPRGPTYGRGLVMTVITLTAHAHRLARAVGSQTVGRVQRLMSAEDDGICGPRYGKCSDEGERRWSGDQLAQSS